MERPGGSAKEEMDKAERSDPAIRSADAIVYIKKGSHDICGVNGAEAISLRGVRVDERVLSLISRNTAERLNALPLAIADDGRVIVAMADPSDICAVDELGFSLRRKIEIRAADGAELRDAIAREYAHYDNAAKDKRSDAYGENMPAVSLSNASLAKNDLRTVDEHAAFEASALADGLIARAVQERASDIHIEPMEDLLRVRFRIDGMLYTAYEVSKKLHAPLISRIKVLADMDIAESRRPQDGRILLTMSGRSMDLRVSTLPTIFGEKAVMRLLDKNGGDLCAEQLGFSPEQLALLKQAVSARNGIVLVTGPTGSGKSTTLHALLRGLNDPSKNIVTIEDPVEYTIAGVTQVPVNERIGRTFGASLRSILRQDPDMIMVGEIRDPETAALAVRAAITGHLVLSTLHTNNAVSAVGRLVDMGVERCLLSSSLRAVVGQRLVRVLCPKCKKLISVGTALSKDTGIPEGTEIYSPVGCQECRGTGYKGRTVISEIMPSDRKVSEFIANGAPEFEISEYVKRNGMRTLWEDARQKVIAGITGADEMLNVAERE